MAIFGYILVVVAVAKTWKGIVGGIGFLIVLGGIAIATEANTPKTRG